MIRLPDAEDTTAEPVVGMAMALKRAGLGACCDEGMPVSARLRWDFSRSPVRTAVCRICESLVLA